ncbi:hypothetical protein [[Mycobacterium] crassicus]|nr:hypothetical protein [Mycolicibacter sp. MYC098]MEB3023382.1 hypothetical protein [Mycolicibacter sp. MYC098]
MLLLRAVIANYHPEAAELSLDWDECGLSCGQLYDSNGAVIEDFEPYDDTYPEDLISLASNVRSVGDMRDVVDGPNNGPFRLRIR